MIMINFDRLIVLLNCWVICMGQQLVTSIYIYNQQILNSRESISVVKDGKVSHFYDQTIYKGLLNCQNGYLNIINNTFGNRIIFHYNSTIPINKTNTIVSYEPNSDPQPNITDFQPDYFILSFNCPKKPNITKSNYFNKVTIDTISFIDITFLLDCDPGGRHKTFQFGYLIIAGLNALILVGVAFHSRVWSLKFNNHRLQVTINWKYILFVCLTGVVLATVFYIFAFNDIKTAFIVLRYSGIAFSLFFMFICFNQIFYLFKVMQIEIYKKLRYCELMSFVCTLSLCVLSLFQQNWILYNIMAIFICVASIKLFHFNSLREAFLSKGIVVLTFTGVSTVLHFLSNRSYNDFLNEISSPFFIVVPDLVHNLYKKCSWLFIADIIFPGLLISYVRLYDINRCSKWGGVYTVWGNITVILSTVLWIGIQALYPFSVPFSLVTYLPLMLMIFLISWKRNEWKDLYSGRFQKEDSLTDYSRFTQKQERFSVMIPQDMIQPLKDNRISFEEHSQQSRQE